MSPAGDRTIAARLARMLGLAPAPLGLRGERHAARHLRRLGYRVLARNLRVAGGEADLVMLAPDRLTIVIVEVKTRLAGAGHPEPERSITARKRSTLLRVARGVLARGRWQGRPVRIDVVAIDWPASGGAPAVRHFMNAVIQGRSGRAPPGRVGRLRP